MTNSSSHDRFQCPQAPPHGIEHRVSHSILGLLSAIWHGILPKNGGLGMETTLDKFGRIVIPKRVRDDLDLKPGSPSAHSGFAWHGGRLLAEAPPG